MNEVTRQKVSPENALMAAGALLEDQWNVNCRWALANSVVFFFFAALTYVVKPESLSLILIAPTVFFVGSFLSFALMVRNGAVLAPLVWFVLGAGIYFGLGSVAGGLRVHPHTELIFGADILYLTHVNLLNASSVLIVIGVALAFGRTRKKIQQTQNGELVELNGFLQKVFPYTLALAAAGIYVKFTFFPIAEDLLLRSIFGKLHLFIPACFLLLGMLWQRLNWPLKTFSLVLFILEVLNGFLALGKYQIIYAMLALIMGILIKRTSWKLMFSTMAALIFVFYALNPLITLGRAHDEYDWEKNTLATRVMILNDAFKAILDPEAQYFAKGSHLFKFGSLKLSEMNRPQERARAMGRRFEVASIQGYLVNEYSKGIQGNTLSNFWLTFIPRILWPEKPIITNFGAELHKKYFNDPSQIYSSIAPTYSAEAYWNYGPLGVVLVSVLLGLVLGWLTHYSFLALLGVRPEYFIIAFPATIWACFVESWLVSTYLGEFLIFVFMLFVSRALLNYHVFLTTKKK